jgi:hypothetical protein
MKSSAGLLLILFALFAIWAYNTGRANAFLSILKSAPASETGGTGGLSAGQGIGSVLGTVLGTQNPSLPPISGTTGINGPTGITVPGTLPGFDNSPRGSSRCVDAFSTDCIDYSFGF